MLNVFALTCEELAGEMKRRYGKGLYHAAALCREIFKRGNTSLAEVAEFSSSPSLTSQIEQELSLPSCKIAEKREDEGVIKFASALSDGQIIESVIIPSRGRTTLCLSSQAGCRMGCRFCKTGQMGLKRQLTAEEMIWQIYAAQFELHRPVDNVVFMGMGEPLDNLRNVAQAVRVMSDQRGLDIALSHITISTSGLADGIRELAALGLPRLRLAVSLNAADDELRTHLMPINRRYPLARLKQALSVFPVGRDGVLLIEYVLFDRINDSQEDARKLAHYLESLPVRINLIPYNPLSSAAWMSPGPETVRRFAGWLDDEGLFVRVRRPRGQKILAACGQLGAEASSPSGIEP